METRMNFARFLLFNSRDTLLSRRSDLLFRRSQHDGEKWPATTAVYEDALGEVDGQLGDIDRALSAAFPAEVTPPIPPR